MKLTVIIPCYNEINTIEKILQKILSLKNINKQVIIIDDNSDDGSNYEIKKTKAKYFFCKKRGYGAAIKLGLSKATKNYIAICEPDGTFKVKDIFKLLKYTKKHDCVFGTRTNFHYIYKGAKMNFFLRSGNIIVAKLMQFLFKSYLSKIAFQLDQIFLFLGIKKASL